MSYQAQHPVLGRADDTDLLRFSYNNVDRLDGDHTLHDFLERGKRLFDERHTEIHYQPGDLLHWDNWRMLHARTAFDDPGRHLKRVQIRHHSPTPATTRQQAAAPPAPTSRRQRPRP